MQGSEHKAVPAEHIPRRHVEHHAVGLYKGLNGLHYD